MFNLSIAPILFEEQLIFPIIVLLKASRMLYIKQTKRYGNDGAVL